MLATLNLHYNFLGSGYKDGDPDQPGRQNANAGGAGAPTPKAAAKAAKAAVEAAAKTAAAAHRASPVRMVGAGGVKGAGAQPAPARSDRILRDLWLRQTPRKETGTDALAAVPNSMIDP